jgi:broad specificity phosphatase PhoE
VTRLLLVRHALHDWVGRGIPGRMPGVTLNGEGELQAQELVQRLETVRLDAIYSSPQQRARETAEPVALARGMRVNILEEFDEIDIGRWQGLTFEQIEAADAARWQAWVHCRSTAQAPGGETFLHARDRAMKGVRRVSSELPEGTALVLSHGDVIKAIVATQLKMSLDDLETFDVACTSITVLDIGDAWSKLQQLNGRTVP